MKKHCLNVYKICFQGYGDCNDSGSNGCVSIALTVRV